MTGNVTIFEYAALSLDVYRDEDRPPLPDGWSLFMDCPEEMQVDGYFGAAYAKHYIGNSYINLIIAHRGTANWQGLVEDIQMELQNKVPSQFKDAAIPFSKAVRKQANDTYGKYKSSLSYTGHSLGAVLAELTTLWDNSGISGDWGVNFESPGSRPFVEQLIADRTLPHNSISEGQFEIVTYNMHVNCLNSAFTHISAPNLVPVRYEYKTLPNGLLPYYPSREYFFAYYSALDQHSMKKIYDYWDYTSQTRFPSSPYSEGYDPTSFGEWPIGEKAAYDYYCNYKPCLNRYFHPHKSYWDGYTYHLWAQYPELKRKYNNDYDAFHDDYVNNVLKHDLENSVTTKIPMNKPNKVEQSDQKKCDFPALISLMEASNHSNSSDQEQVTKTYHTDDTTTLLSYISFTVMGNSGEPKYCRLNEKQNSSDDPDQSDSQLCCQPNCTIS